MLEIQKYILSEGRNWEYVLKECYGVDATFHPTDNRVIFNYGIGAPKTHPIVMEARGLTLDRSTWAVVAKSFTRFFNLEEMVDHNKNFVWDGCEAFEKLDGSLAILYFWNGEWHFQTRGSFGDAKVNNADITWRELFKRALPWEKTKVFDKGYTYIFELCSPYNKVVREYKEPSVTLLAIFDNVDELKQEDVDIVAELAGLNRPQRYSFSNQQEVANHISSIAASDPTYEGVVLLDRNGMRLKCKSPTYCALHHLKGNDNIFNPKNLIPLVLNGEFSEVETYFPECKDSLYKVKDRMDRAYDNMMKVWNETKHIESPRDFAFAIANRTPFTSILFDARKNKTSPTSIWIKSSDRIYNNLFKGAKYV